MPRRTAFGHIGWRCLDGRYYYLHAAGAIGAHEVRRDVEVAVSEALRPFELPDPPRGEKLVEAVRETLGVVEVAREEIGYVLLALIGRAPLGHCDSAVWLFGETGSFKSELAALCQQHWGAGLDARHLPSSFTATANYIEGLLFMAKDALAVVDDFAPEGSGHDLLRAHREAARVIRAQGNLQARGRMRADGGLRSVKPPRGLLLGTGEEVPRGHSVRARMLIVGVENGDVDTAKLTELQQHARSGVLAASLAGYVEQLAGAYEENHRRAAARIEELRVNALPSRSHRRTPDAVAQLKLGLECYLAYAHEVGAITAAERAALARSGFEALEALGLRQAAHQTSSEPASRFLELLGSAISSGSAHVADPDGAQPANPEAWGWHRIEIADDLTWRAQGTRVGWVDGHDLWLDPDASYGAAQDLARRVADPFSVSRTTLNKRLAERGMLASTDLEKRQCVPVRRVIAGVRRQVLHMPTDQLVQFSASSELRASSTDGRDGQDPHQEELLAEDADTLVPPPEGTTLGVQGVKRPDQSDQLPPASVDEEAEYERVVRKYGVTEVPDS